MTWHSHQALLKSVRKQVFIIEQRVPIELELDELDADATHLLAINSEKQAIGCARLLGDGSIGRMAVLKDWRGYGIGSELLKMAITIQQQHGVQMITLSAQTHAICFYEKAGFEVISEPYLEANITHIDMRLLSSNG